MVTNEIIPIFKKFCSGLHQDFDLSNSSVEKLVEFCRGFLNNDEAEKFKDYLIKFSTFDEIDQMKIWNNFFENAFLKDSKSARNFTNEVIEIFHV